MIITSSMRLHFLLRFCIKEEQFDSSCAMYNLGFVVASTLFVQGLRWHLSRAMISGHVAQLILQSTADAQYARPYLDFAPTDVTKNPVSVFIQSQLCWGTCVVQAEPQ